MRFRVLGSVLMAGVALTPMQAQQPPPGRDISDPDHVANWIAPPFWSPLQASREPRGHDASPRTASDVRPQAIQTDLTGPLPFVAVAPCRILDTRVTGGPIASGFTRDAVLTGPPCGIPANAAAVSANFVVFNISAASGNGVLKVFPTGSSSFQALLNWAPSTTQIDNASVVSLGTNGSITLLPAQGGGFIDLVIDVNGYYPFTGVVTTLNTLQGDVTLAGSNGILVPAPSGATITVTSNATSANTPSAIVSRDASGNFAAGTASLVGDISAANASLTGRLGLPATNGALTAGVVSINGVPFLHSLGAHNTYVGAGVGVATTSGTFNSAFGESALSSNAAGASNSAFGADALTSSLGVNNSAFGVSALFSNGLANDNSAFGVDALSSNTTGSFNSSFGAESLRNNLAGGDNAAFGVNTLTNSTGNFNSAFGMEALASLASGNHNVALGFNAGFSLTSGSNNIYIGNDDATSESNTIRVGNTTHTATFIAAISGKTSASGIAVLINSSGQLGTTTSSRRFKQDIVDLGDESDVLLKLRPVAFLYKPEYDPDRIRQYGLVAEEVAQMAPGLVVFDKEGRPETVRYHLVNAMLLNEVQKQHRVNEEQGRRIEEQRGQIRDLTERLLALERKTAAAGGGAP